MELGKQDKNEREFSLLKAENKGEHDCNESCSLVKCQRHHLALKRQLKSNTETVVDLRIGFAGVRCAKYYYYKY